MREIAISERPSPGSPRPVRRRLTDIVTGKGRLSADEAFRGAADWLDAYVNSLYRSVKNARDGRLLAARLDTADSIRALLEFLFALNRRPRPYDKYLQWEPERFLLPKYDTGALLDPIGRIMEAGDTSVGKRKMSNYRPKQAEHHAWPQATRTGTEAILITRPQPANP
ncbi:hypothetical protein [Streptomyces sp. NBC_01092]|uniref:hypothetical protein n=1 Tax=Streptomyces sp. NBC_01092 TaxID=2903748 RepID=UPI00386B95BB